MSMLTRRKLLQQAGLGLVATGLPGLSLANTDTDARFVLVILRGALDGLATVPPYGDGNYTSQRGELALGKPGDENGILRLDGLFGLHPALRKTHEFYGLRQASVIHAVASPYRSRSHFDGQDVLETGAAGVGRARNGWLNRSIASQAAASRDPAAIALAQNTPLVLRGNSPVTSWAPSRLPDASDDTIHRIQDLYADDEFFAARLSQALETQKMAGVIEGTDGRRRYNEVQQWKTAAEAAARFLTAADGPGIAVLEAGGWDTHANQGAESGYLASRLGALDEAIAALASGLGEAWERTVVAVVTEFGRTVAVNGTRGTDHGTAAAALLLGGAVDGGRVVADWPGLGAGDLYESRDLYPTTDLRSVFKAILQSHLGVPESHVEETVFPDSRQAKPLDGLMRRSA
jgi:uncharacterized protein (DUF1501 family)